jgi:predicted nucleotidyltransferase
MSPVDKEKAKKNLEKRILEKHKIFSQLWKQAVDDFEKITKMIIKNYKPKRLYQWGSVMKKNYFNDNSDIDIAVEGDFTAQDFFKMYEEADSLTKFSLDLVDINKIDPIYAESIKRNGRIVYEHK